MKKAISSGELVQITSSASMKTDEDVMWLRGSNQGEKEGTFLSTKWNGKTFIDDDGGGIGIPEDTGNQAVMLSETSKGRGGNYSFAKKGKAYRFTGTWGII